VINAIQALQDTVIEDKLIILSAKTHAEDVCIRVIDNGPGIEESKIRRLFELVDSEKPEGMGIGLWICRHIAERHEGRIAYRHHHPTGAIFEITLPYERKQHSPA
jgi:signal transduction histidine kinase